MCAIKRLILALILCTGTAYGYTADDGAKTCTSDGSLSDTQAAITYIKGKAQDDWVLTVDSAGGTHDWGSQLLVDVGRPFTMQGAASKTTITSSNKVSFGIVVACYANKVTTLKNFRFTSWAGNPALIGWYGDGVVIHISNCYFSQGSGAVMYTGGGAGEGGAGPFGCIDNSEFVGHLGCFIRQNTNSPDANWPDNHPITWGTDQAIFFEDNVITGPSAKSMTDGNQAGKIVFRYNTVINAGIGSHGRDSGGQAGVLWRHGFLSMEIYNNVFIASIALPAPLINIRSGTGLIWGNTLTGSGGAGKGVELQVHCAQSNFASEGCLDCSGNVRTHALIYNPGQPDNEYPDCQQPGKPVPVRVWSNGGNSMTYGWASGLNNFSQPTLDYILSSDDSAKPSGYVPYNNGNRHPLNPGPSLSIPVNNAAPIVTGAAAQGQTLSSTKGNWSGYPSPTYTYQWRRCDESGGSCSDIAGATSSTYLQTAGDVGYTHRIVVAATNSAGGSIYATSVQNGVTTAPGAENRLSNPGFEIHTGGQNGDNNANAAWEGWTTSPTATRWDIETTTSQAHSGSAALKVRTKNFGTFTIKQGFVPSAVGTIMTGSFWHNNSIAGHGWTYSIVKVIAGVETISLGPTAVDYVASTDYAKEQFEWTVPVCDSAIIVFDTSNFQTQDGRLDDVVMAPPAESRPSPPQNLRVLPGP